MEQEQLKLLAKRFYEEVLNHGEIAVIDELIADDFVEHESMPGVPSTREGVGVWVALMRSAFPDLVVTVNNVAVEGNEIWVHSVIRGTHLGTFMGIPATGRPVEIAGFDRVRVRDGKAVEHWGITDNLALLQQLGQIPA